MQLNVLKRNKKKKMGIKSNYTFLQRIHTDGQKKYEKN